MNLSLSSNRSSRRVSARPFAALAALVVCLALPGPTAQAVSAPHTKPNPFVVPPELEPDVAFWTRIYTEVETSGGLIHDSRRLDVVYEKTTLPESSRRARERVQRAYEEPRRPHPRRRRSARRRVVLANDTRRPPPRAPVANANARAPLTSSCVRTASS